MKSVRPGMMLPGGVIMVRFSPIGGPATSSPLAVVPDVFLRAGPGLR